VKRNDVPLTALCAVLLIHEALRAQEAQRPAGGGLFEVLFLFVIPFILIFYVFFIRPQQKEQKKRREMLNAVEKGDRIRTIGGIYGKVTNVTDEHITLLVDEKNDVKIKVLKRAVASIKGKTEDVDTFD